MPASRKFECRATGELCSRGDCSKRICREHEAEEAANLKIAEDRLFQEADLLAREIEQVAKEWLPRVVKPGQKITAQNKGPALKVLARHPKVIEEAKRRRREMVKLVKLLKL
jgi:hypothetical protein